MSHSLAGCPKCGRETSSRDGHRCMVCDYVPEEEEMRRQMWRTMQKLEKAADAVIEHLTADKQPFAPSVPDYSSLRAVCDRCGGVVAFEDYERVPESSYDTCTCSDVGFREVALPPDVVAVYAAVHEARLKPPIHACPRCRRPTVATRETGLCGLCEHNAHAKNWKKNDDAAYLFEGNVLVKGDLTVEGSHVSSESRADTPPFNSELESIRGELAKHRKALALIAKFFDVSNLSVAMPHPEREVERLIGLTACEECRGTGWLARDESCRTCQCRGYIEI